MAVTPLGDGRYRVASQSGNEYTVDLPKSDCSCPDHELRHERCKHLRRVALEITLGNVAPPGRVRETCAACDRPSFVPEDGPALCDACRLDPGDVVRDRETGNLLVVARATDRRADEWFLEDVGSTVADYANNRGYPADDVVVEAVYPFVDSRRKSIFDGKRYAFPRSRLERLDQQFIR